MNSAVQVLEKQIAIGQAEHDHVAALGQFSVKPGQQLQYVGLEICRLGRFARVASADIVSDEFQEEEDGMVVVRISLQGFDVAPRVS